MRKRVSFEVDEHASWGPIRWPGFLRGALGPNGNVDPESVAVEDLPDPGYAVPHVIWWEPARMFRQEGAMWKCSCGHFWLDINGDPEDGRPLAHVREARVYIEGAR